MENLVSPVMFVPRDPRDEGSENKHLTNNLKT